MITIESKGSFRNTENFLSKMSGDSIYAQLDKYAQDGVFALSEATPKDSGRTSEGWSYAIDREGKATTISWSNDRMTEGVPVVILLQYGHATGTGGFVQGKDFINPSIMPIFDEIADNVWKAVKSA